MTNREAINVMEKYADAENISPVVAEAHRMAIAALEKQEAMKPDFHTNGLGEYFSCPKCGNSDRGLADYCNKCGQHLEWEEDAE